MKISCPSCSKLIPPSGLNVKKDVALCAGCNEAFSISELVASGQDAEGFDFSDPPRGVWFDETYDGWTIGATTRSVMAFFLVPFMCVWSGFSIGGIYGQQIVDGEFNLSTSLFGIPFLIGTIVLGSVALMTVCGKVTVTIEKGEGRVFTGVGPIGWSRRFDWASIKRVEEDHMSTQHAGSQGMVICLVGTKKLKFGSMLTEDRRDFLLQALRKLLVARPSWVTGNPK